MAFAGILGSLMGNVGLIEKGANLLGIDVAPWAKAGMGIAAHTFGSKGDAGGGGMEDDFTYDDVKNAVMEKFDGPDIE